MTIAASSLDIVPILKAVSGEGRGQTHDVGP
jgi:hypothetical protein